MIKIEKAAQICETTVEAVKAQLRREAKKQDNKDLAEWGDLLSINQCKAVSYSHSLFAELENRRKIEAVITARKAADSAEEKLRQHKRITEAKEKRVTEEIKALAQENTLLQEQLQGAKSNSEDCAKLEQEVTKWKALAEQHKKLLHKSEQDIENLASKRVELEKRINTLEVKNNQLEAKYKPLAAKLDTEANVYKGWLIAINVICIVFTAISSFKAFGVNDWFSITLAISSFSLFGVFTGATYWITQQPSKHKVNVALFASFLMASIEFALHYLAFTQSLDSKVVPHVVTASIIGSLVIAGINWFSLYLQK